MSRCSPTSLSEKRIRRTRRCLVIVGVSVISPFSERFSSSCSSCVRSEPVRLRDGNTKLQSPQDPGRSGRRSVIRAAYQQSLRAIIKLLQLSKELLETAFLCAISCEALGGRRRENSQAKARGPKQEYKYPSTTKRTNERTGISRPTKLLESKPISVSEIGERRIGSA